MTAVMVYLSTKKRILKMKTVKAILAVTILTSLIFAQSTIRVASNSSSGTYDKMLGEIIQNCNDDSLTITRADGVSGGAPGNLDALVNNKADAAFLHSDVYLFNAQSDPSYNKYKTLVALYPEQIHVLALRQSKTKKTGSWIGSTQDFESLSEMGGYQVGAAGGGAITAKILSGQGGGNFTVVDEGSGDAVISALNSGQIAAAIFVGAAPLPNIEKLDKRMYKLIPIGESIERRVSGVYRKASINYPGLTTGPLQTAAPVATLLTRQFSTGPKLAAQIAMRNCFNKHLPELQDNGSPNWQEVQAGDHGVPVIPWLDLPAAESQTKKR